MKLSPSFRRSHHHQQGYILMIILLMMALLLVALVAIAPRMATEIRREREEETIHRGKQYATAVKRYFKKFGRYPTSIEQLENTNNTRFLRKRYKDPMTGQDFRILHFGEQKSVPKGLFGAAIGGGGAAAPGGMGGGIAGGGLPGAIIGNALGGGSAGPGTQAGPGATGSGAPAGQGAQGDQGSQPGVSADSISRPLSSGQTFGGGPIIGVAGTKNQAALKAWNDKTNYKDWEFYYDPRYDVQQPLTQGVQGVGLPGQPGVGPNPNPNPPRGPGGSMGPK